MIHPDCTLRFVSPAIGFGVFATAPIPMGSLVYVKDELELEISPERYRDQPAAVQQAIEKYSYIDERGQRMLSWDFAKYVNHCCDFNTISTAYGFEIAIRDIMPGEELTDEYGLFNLEHPMPVCCGKAHCRGMVYQDDVLRFAERWDELIRSALKASAGVQQPLWSLMDEQTQTALRAFQKDNRQYRSVRELYYRAPYNGIATGADIGER